MSNNGFPVDEAYYQAFRAAILRGYAERGLLPSEVNPDVPQTIVPSTEFGTPGSGTAVTNPRIVRDDNELTLSSNYTAEQLAVLDEATLANVRLRAAVRTISRLLAPTPRDLLGGEVYDRFTGFDKMPRRNSIAEFNRRFGDPFREERRQG